MKAQISIEYIIALSVFVLFVSIILLQFYAQRPAYIKELKFELLRSEAFQISELLINDPGSPEDWDSNPPIVRPGLLDETSDKTNLLSSEKIDAFNEACDDYQSVKNMLDSEYDFSIYLRNFEPTPELLIDCYPSEITLRTSNVTISRIVAIDDGEHGELTVQVW